MPLHEGSYPTTLGFSPLVQVHSVWHTPRGYELFLSLIQESVNHVLSTEGSLPHIEPSEELTRIYQGGVRALTPSENESRLHDPPQAIRQAIQYATTMLVTRVRMHRRLANMKLQCASGRTLQPRGRNAATRGELYHKETANYDGAFAGFLSNQNALRKRFE